MQTFYQMNAMYAKIEPGDQIDASPVKLGDKVLYPGEWVSKLGETERASFEMNDGYYLRFVGSGMEGKHRVLLFAVNRSEREEICYAFNYVNSHTLVIGGRGKCKDIRVQNLEKFTELPADAEEIREQLTLF